MSSAQVDRPTKVGHVNKKESEKSRKLFTQQQQQPQQQQQSSSHNKKHKHDESRHFKFGRKRIQCFTGNGKFFPPYKRRKKEGGIIPPTKFLLGGNICDPLNLNSMQDEEINRAMNAVTPKSSPLPTPKHRKETIKIIIPPNLNDPLNLNNLDVEDYEKQLISPTKKGSKRRYRKRKRASSGSGKSDTTETPIETAAAAATTSSTATTTTVIEPVTSTEDVATENKQQHEELQQKEQPQLQSQQEQKEQQQQQQNNILPAENVQIIEPQLPESSSPPPPPPLITATTTVSSKDQKLDSPQKDKNKLRLKGLDDVKDKRLRKIENSQSKIVSPVIPQPGAWKTRQAHRPNQDKKKKGKQTLQLPNFRDKDSRYQYGNYDRYYGYRNLHHEIDPRLNVFAQRKELFFGKDVLDIGCNIGHITLSVARDFSAHSVTGIDIDRKLIGIARSNIKHYVNCVRSPASNQDNNDGKEKGECDASFFPMSMPINYGPIDVPGFTKNKDHKGFPYNVTFVQGNYILEDDSLLTSEQPQFDTILCLSITKWLHLNFGDDGLKQAFKRMHAQLRPGGVLVLESQSWAGYGKKKRLTERIYRNYHSIQFFPQKFTQYLLSSEVGFTKCEVVSIPPHPSKGFQRPIQLFTKAGTSPERAASSLRFIARRAEKRACELRAFERDLFPHEMVKFGNLSDLSQRSIESLGHYEQLENVYAPITTPCYDTPSHNNDSQPFEPEKSCYVYAEIKTDATQQQDQVVNKLTEEPENLRLKELRKRKTGDSPTSCTIDSSVEAKKSREEVNNVKEENKNQGESSGTSLEHEKSNNVVSTSTDTTPATDKI